MEKVTSTISKKTRNTTRHKNKKTSIGMSHNTKNHSKGSRLYKKKYKGQGK